MKRLISKTTGVEIQIGDWVRTFRGADALVRSFNADRNRVTVAVAPKGWILEFYPSVIDAEFKEISK